MRNILFILFVGLSFSLFAQSTKEKKAEKYYDKYNYDKAIEEYESIDGLNVENQRNLAKSYCNRHQYIEAEYAYKRFINSPAATADDYFNYALLLKTNNKYSQVKRWMEKIQELNPNDLRARNFFETEKKATSWQKKNKDYSIQNLDFNNDNSDFGAVFYKNNQVVFTSTRKGNRAFLFREYTWNKMPFLSIFEADLDQDKQFKKIRFWNKEQTKKWHEGPISFSNDYTFAAFTRDNYSDNIVDNTIRLEIYFTHLVGDKWSEPEPFYLNNPAYSVGHAALSDDGQTLFFVSDMPGGYGGSDIYYVERNADGSWGEPVNAGDNINTEGNEEFPFYDSKNALLFFSSSGLSGLGGLDIFVASKYPCCFKFDKPENLGAPINSRYDDFSFIIDKCHKQGFFSSNRPTGEGDDDIYYFTFDGEYKKYPPAVAVPVAQKEEKSSMQYNLLVLNKTNNRPIEKAVITLDDIRVETDSLGVITRELDSPTLLTVDAIGYKQTSKMVFVDSREDALKDTVLLAVAENEHIVLKNIYYDFDKSDILPESAVELNKVVRFMKDNPDMTIELSSHTDSRGSDAYNIRLSQARANSAVNYIVSKGINPDKIKAKGYGETRPRNRCTNGVPCSEPEHRENRRTEIFISGYGAAEHIEQTKGKE
jgi:outer membrane protein OmpA-like peptidoglycan-associated protein